MLWIRTCRFLPLPFWPPRGPTSLPCVSSSSSFVPSSFTRSFSLSLSLSRLCLSASLTPASVSLPTPAGCPCALLPLLPLRQSPRSPFPLSRQLRSLVDRPSRGTLATLFRDNGRSKLSANSFSFSFTEGFVEGTATLGATNLITRVRIFER